MPSTGKIPVLSRLFRRPRPKPPAAVERAAPSALESVERVRDRYPGVRAIALNLSIKAPDFEIEPTLNGRSLGPDARAYFHFKCKNVECVGGGFDLSDTIDEAIAARRGDATGRRVCKGWESRQLVNQRRCHYELNFKIVISYHG